MNISLGVESVCDDNIEEESTIKSSAMLVPLEEDEAQGSLICEEDQFGRDELLSELELAKVVRQSSTDVLQEPRLSHLFRIFVSHMQQEVVKDEITAACS